MFDNIFRLNPIFTITPADELTEKQKKTFRRVFNKKGFYGLLHAPPEAKVTVKAIGRDLADFLTDLRQPKKLTGYDSNLKNDNRKEKKQFIIQLILDSVLEVEHEKRFISGVEAVNRVLLPSSHLRFSRDHIKASLIQSLSNESLNFAYNSAIREPRDLSFFLYNFNRVPLTRRWRERFPDEASLSHYLELRNDCSWKNMPGCIQPRPLEKTADGGLSSFDQHWKYWTVGRDTIPVDLASYKIYISPIPDDLPAVFRIVRERVADSGAIAMKIGRNLVELLRADKFIVYFLENAPAFGFARELAAGLTSFRCQGVPFSHQVNPDNALISMGVDPPRSFGQTHSWRLYITNKLALAIQGAWRAGAKEPKEYIRTYMEMIGVDSVEWCPLDKDWRMNFELEEKEDGRSQE
jgi:hypothetical protein